MTGTVNELASPLSCRSIEEVPVSWWPDPDEDADAKERRLRHWKYHRMLLDADRHESLDACEWLMNAAGRMDAGILPPGFFQKLIVVHQRINKLGRKRKRNSERNERICSEYYFLLRGYDVRENSGGAYTHGRPWPVLAARTHLAERYVLSK